MNFGAALCNFETWSCWLAFWLAISMQVAAQLVPVVIAAVLIGGLFVLGVKWGAGRKP